MQELEWRDNPMDCDTGIFERVARTPHMTDIPPRLGLWDISVEENVVFHNQHHPGAAPPCLCLNLCNMHATHTHKQKHTHTCSMLARLSLHFFMRAVLGMLVDDSDCFSLLHHALDGSNFDLTVFVTPQL
jgi:hypothetical protein